MHHVLCEKQQISTRYIDIFHTEIYINTKVAMISRRKRFFTETLF